LRVPEDVAVIGCGNLRLSEYLEVPLSTIDQSTQQQGEEAAKLALSLITGKHKRGGKHLLIEPKLIARESTIGRKS
jgi:LacI family transcriptional regulator